MSAAEELTTGETEPPTPEPEPEPEPEPVNPDAEPEPEVEPIEPPAEPAAEPAAPAGLSEKEREKQQKDLDKEAKRHTDTVTRLLGAESEEVTECPFCDPQLLGFFFDAQLATPRSDMQAAMIAALAQPNEPEYRDAADVGRCQVCDGWGKTLTGSRNVTHKSKVCANCKGYGYQPPPGTQPVEAGGLSEVPPLALASEGPMVTDDTDAWGSPRLLGDGQENPNYGRMPQYKNPELP